MNEADIKQELDNLGEALKQQMDEESEDARTIGICTVILHFMSKHYPDDPHKVVDILLGTMIGVCYASNFELHRLIAETVERWARLDAIHAPPQEGDAVH
jgi:hypothetical protein